jgi:transcriptional regulator with XRE-family HTH domain
MDDCEAQKQFGERIHRKRLMCGMNQRTLANRIDSYPVRISKLESGKYASIGIGELRKLVKALQTSADYLLGLSSDPGEIPEHTAIMIAV